MQDSVLERRAPYLWFPLGIQQSIDQQILMGELQEKNYLIGLEVTVSSAHIGLLVPARMENFMIYRALGRKLREYLASVEGDN